jgi:glycosyltransferase involved in cell wall biosynthesis
MYGTWGIDPQEFTPAPDGREPGWPPGTLLFVGRIDEEKGIDDLLRAFQAARRRVPGVRLEIVGSGPKEAEARAWVAAQRLQDVVHFHGTVKHRDLPPLFRAATVFVSPAVTTRRWEEYVGMTNIQAMGCGVPVVSTRSGAIPEYVPPGAGLLVPERDPAALAEALTRLLQDEGARRAMGRAGREHAVCHYDARRNVIAAETHMVDRVLG